VADELFTAALDVVSEDTPEINRRDLQGGFPPVKVENYNDLPPTGNAKAHCVCVAWTLPLMTTTGVKERTPASKRAATFYQWTFAALLYVGC
jgi:hypothetical protein